MKKAYPEIRKKLEKMILGNSGQVIRLPSLQTLAKEFGCTAPTMMRAVQSLVANGYLTPRRGGGYISVPRNASDYHVKIAAQIVGSGMLEYEFSYFIQMRFHSVCELGIRCENCNRVGISELKFHTYDESNLLLRKGTYSGVILAAPMFEILKRTEKFCRSASIPLGVFGGTMPAGQVSAYYDVEDNFSTRMDALQKLGRRRILEISQPDPSRESARKSLFDRYADRFECVEFFSGDSERIAAYIRQNTGGKGKNFDTVVFLTPICGMYEELRKNAPQCLCVMSNFAAALIPDYHGWINNFDIESAGKIFGKAMYDAIWRPDVFEPVHIPIPFSIMKK